MVEETVDPKDAFPKGENYVSPGENYWKTILLE